MTLTEFLLARIAEDEEVARSNLRADSFHRTITSEIVGELSVRVLAECEAKRRIVETAKYVDEVEGGGADIVLHSGYRGGVWGVLPALAAVYADHPDYREDWRP